MDTDASDAAALRATPDSRGWANVVMDRIATHSVCDPEWVSEVHARMARMDAAALTAVRDAIEGRSAAEHLDEEGEALFFDLCSHVGPSPEAVRFFAERRKRGGGVGMDEHGRLVRGLPGGGVEVIKEAAANDAIE